MKQASPTKPRIVFYVSPAEMKALRLLAQANGLRTPSQFVAMSVRVQLAKL